MEERETERYKLIREIDDKQRLTIVALVAGKTQAEGADAAGVSRVRVNRWVNHHPGFQAAMNGYRAELVAQQTDAIRHTDSKAMNIVMAHMEYADFGEAMSWIRTGGLAEWRRPPSARREPRTLSTRR